MQKSRENLHGTQRQVGMSAFWRSGNGKGVAAPERNIVAAGVDLVERTRALEERVAALRRQRDELHQALFAAEQVQRKLCAPRKLRRGQFEIASEIFPVRYISGDFYDVLDLGAALVLAVGDIAGKGLAAGLWFTHLIGLIRIYARSLPDPAAAAAAINRDLCRMHAEPPMASLFLARLDPQRGELAYCNAGQPPAFVLRRNGIVESLEEGGPLLGAVRQAQFRVGRIDLAPGDVLIGYSDGIIECRNDRGEEFGARRLLAAAKCAGEVSAGTMLFSILGAMQDFAGRHPREDDLTLMVVRRQLDGRKR